MRRERPARRRALAPLVLLRPLVACGGSGAADTAAPAAPAGVVATPRPFAVVTGRPGPIAVAGQLVVTLHSPKRVLAHLWEGGL